MNTMEIEAIKIKVKNGDYKLKDKLNIKSDVWERFKEIVDENEEVIKDVVACKLCCKVLAFHSHKTGTSSLRKHRCFKPAPIKKCRNKLKTPNKSEKLANQQMILKNMCLKLSSLKCIVRRSLLEGATSALTEDNSGYWRENGEEVLPDKEGTVASPDIKTMTTEETEKLEADERSNSPIGMMPVVCKIESIADDDLLEAIGNQVHHLSHMRNHNSFSATSSSSASKYLEEADGPYSQHYKRTRTSSLNGDREGEPSPEIFPQSNSKPFSETTNRIYEDEHDVFGRHIANELRSLPDDVARRWARFNIQKTLFEAHSFERKETQ